MPFPSFNFCELVNETWNNSTFRTTLEETKYLFFIFKKTNNDYIFKGIKLWNMPELVLENEVKEMWTKTVETMFNQVLELNQLMKKDLG